MMLMDMVMLRVKAFQVFMKRLIISKG